MHIVTQKSELASQLSFVSGASDSRGTVPMLGTVLIKAMPDGWTVITKDHSLTAQWELMMAVTKTGYDVLTWSDGSPTPPDFITAIRT